MNRTMGRHLAWCVLIAWAVGCGGAEDKLTSPLGDSLYAQASKLEVTPARTVVGGHIQVRILVPKEETSVQEKPGPGAYTLIVTKPDGSHDIHDLERGEEDVFVPLAPIVAAQEGLYLVDAYIGEAEVTGSGAQVVVGASTPETEAENSRLAVEKVEYAIGEHVKMWIEPYATKPGTWSHDTIPEEFELKVVPGKGGEQKVELRKDEDGNLVPEDAFRFFFLEGFTVEATYLGHAIPGSGAEVEVGPSTAETEAGSSAMSVSPAKTVVGGPIFVEVTPFSNAVGDWSHTAGADEFTLTITAPGGGKETQALVFREDDGALVPEGGVFAEAQGVYTFDVTYEGLPISGSGAQVEVAGSTPDVEAAASSVEVSPSKTQVGGAIEVVIAPFSNAVGQWSHTAGADEFTLTVTRPDGTTSTPPLVTREDDGAIVPAAAITATQEGVWRFDVTYQGLPIAGSGATVEVEPLLQTSAKTSTITVLQETVEAGGKVEYVITAKDENGDPRGVGGDSVKASLLDSGGGVVVSGAVAQDHQDGTYSGGIVVDVPGDYTVTGEINGEAMTDTAEVTVEGGRGRADTEIICHTDQGRDFQTVKAGVDNVLEAVSYKGTQLKAGEVTIEGTSGVTVQLKDVTTNEIKFFLTVKLTGPFSLTFTVKKAGQAAVSKTCDYQAVSPISINCPGVTDFSIQWPPDQCVQRTGDFFNAAAPLTLTLDSVNPPGAFELGPGGIAVKETSPGKGTFTVSGKCVSSAIGPEANKSFTWFIKAVDGAGFEKVQLCSAKCDTPKEAYPACAP